MGQSAGGGAQSILRALTDPALTGQYAQNLQTHTFKIVRKVVCTPLSQAQESYTAAASDKACFRRKPVSVLPPYCKRLRVRVDLMTFSWTTELSCSLHLVQERVEAVSIMVHGTQA